MTVPGRLTLAALIAALAVALLTALLVAAPGAARAPGTAVCTAGDVTLVSEVQGPGDASPLVGTEVVVRGVVTGVFPGLRGFFVQEEPADDDGDPATSEGVFVFSEDRDLAGLAAGARVEVAGTVAEFRGLTELTALGDVTDCGLPPVELAPAALDLPADDAAREALEGTLVTTGTTELTVTDLFGPYRFGEIGLSAVGVLRQPTDRFRPDDPAAARLAAANASAFLVVDDGGAFGGEAAPWLDGPTPPRAGDVVQGPVTGPLHHAFDEYKVEPLSIPGIVPRGSRPAEPVLEGGERIAYFNVLNLFNGDGAGGGFPTSRGAKTPAQYVAQLDGVVRAIGGLGAAVVGVVEVENDYGEGASSSIAQLVDALDAADGADGGTDGSWAYVDPGTSALGTDEIAVGLLYRPALANPVGAPATVDVDDGLSGDENRWPLAQTFDLGGTTRTVVVNHLKSKGSGCEDVSTLPGVDPSVAFDGDPGDPLQGSCVRTRTYAVDRLLRWLGTEPVAPADATLLGGDLNSYAQEVPLQVLARAGWTDLVAARGDDAASYAFDGRFGRLDHAFASPGDGGAFVDADVWRINSPEPYGLLYEFADTPGVYASSDHDPVLVSLPGEVTAGTAPASSSSASSSSESSSSASSAARTPALVEARSGDGR